MSDLNDNIKTIQLALILQQMHDDMSLLFSLLPDWTRDVPQNLDATQYGTASYSGDMLVKKKVDALKERWRL